MGKFMSQLVYCQKLKKNAPALPKAPYPGELGQRIVENICAQAWQLWLKQQTLLINENRLNLLAPEARSFLEQQMVQFLFEDNDEKPQGYVPLS